jgi:hypothetical protein
MRASKTKVSGKKLIRGGECAYGKGQSGVRGGQMTSGSGREAVIRGSKNMTK